MESCAQHKEHTIPSFDFGSSDDEQETKPPPSTEQKIIKHEKLIEEMEQTIDQNTLMIKRLSNMIKTLEDKAEDTYNHPDITSKDREAKMKVRNKQRDILATLETMDNKMVKLIKAKDIAYDKIREMKQELQDTKDEIKQHDKFILKNRENIA